ncbi:MAG: hypothetical protein ACR2PT_05690 [Endozoicomonas sp.]
MKRVICLFLGAMLFSAMTFSFDHTLSFKVMVGPDGGKITVVYQRGLAYRVVMSTDHEGLSDREMYSIEFGRIQPDGRFHQLGELHLNIPGRSRPASYRRMITLETTQGVHSGYVQILADQRGFLQESGLASHFTQDLMEELIPGRPGGTVYPLIGSEEGAQANGLSYCRIEGIQRTRNSRLLTESADLGQQSEIVMVNPQFIFLLESMMQQFSIPLVNEPAESQFQYAMMTMFLLVQQPGFPNILQAYNTSAGPTSDSWLFTPIQNNEIGSHQVQLNLVDFNEVHFQQFFPPQLTQHVPAGPYYFEAVGGIVQMSPVQDVRQHHGPRHRGAVVLAAFLTLLCAALLGYYGAY